MTYNKLKVVPQARPVKPITVPIDPSQMLTKSQFQLEILSKQAEGELGDALTTRTDGEFKGRAVYLDNEYDWVIGEDSEECICLIPLRKKD